MLIKRSAFAIGAIVVYFFVEFFSYLIFKGFYRESDIVDNIYNFLPFKSLWNLIDEPGSRLGAVKEIASVAGQDLSYDYAVHWYEIVIVLGWSAIFIYFSYKLLLKRDL